MALISLLVMSPSTSPPVGHEFVKVGQATVHLVKIDSRPGTVRFETVCKGRLTQPWKFVGETQPVAAITGTFFTVANGVPVADVVVNGGFRVRGNRGSVVAIDPFGQLSLHDAGYRRNFDWSSFDFGFRGAIRLISNGTVRPNPKAQRFTDRRLWGRAARTGIGIDKNGKTILAATSAPLTLSEFGRALRSRGVMNAVAVDGGSSAMLYYNGRMLVSAKRSLSNLLVVRAGGPENTVPNVTRLATLRRPTPPPLPDPLPQQGPLEQPDEQPQ